MAPIESEIVVEDPDTPADNSPAVMTTRTAEVATYLVLLAWRWSSPTTTGAAAWDGQRRSAERLLPFYLCMILGGASLFGLGSYF
jgi:hypothetical protein